MTVRELPDMAERRRAWSSEAGVVVEASAGTGKTFLLVQRALWFLFVREVRIERIVALAFGEKAARETARRLRAVLQGVACAGSLDSLPEELAAMAPAGPLAALQNRARAALESFPRAHISTIHAFASDLLRLFPVEAGVDPSFNVDEGRMFKGYLGREWDIFLAGELAAGSPRAALWRNLLDRVRLRDIGDLAAALAGFRVDLAGVLEGRAERGEIRREPRLAAWLRGVREEAVRLREAVEDASQRAVRPVRFLDAVVAACAALEGGGDVPEELLEELGSSVAWPAGLAPEDAAAGERLVRTVRYLRHVRSERLVFAALDLLKPFAARVRKALLESGHVPFEGLLSLARDLLRDRREVREALKRRFDAVLVDEAQDVDPLQLEMILYLAEREGEFKRDWRKVSLHPGKLFIVGDPKQSIYGFRNADLEAFHAVLRQAEGGGVERVRLATSMRSHPAILSFVNAAGPPLFPGKTPPYLGLAANPERVGSVPRPRVVLLGTEREEGGEAWRGEAISVANWIRAEMGGGTAPEDIAVLFRNHNWISRFAAALRDLGVPAVIEEEHDFFTRQEITDLLNIVFLACDPADEAALAGVLRGPGGGLDDDALAAWFNAWRRSGSRRSFSAFGAAAGAEGIPAHLPGLFPVLGRLSADLPLVPGRAWTERMWRDLAVDAYAAGSGRPGAPEAVASFRRLLAGLLEERGVAGALAALRESVREERRGRRPALKPPALAEGREPRAVRLLTIHQAKGLEFPVVVLAGAGAGDRPPRSTESAFVDDWASGFRGAVLTAKGSKEALMTLEGAWISAARREREIEEKRRVLYVGLTRARDVLVVSLARKEKGSPGDSLFSPIAELLESPGDLMARETATVPAARPVPSTGPAGPAEVPVEGEPPEITAEPETVSPSGLVERTGPPGYEMMPPGAESFDLLLGEVCHRVLEKWDFGGAPAGLPEAVERALASMDVPAGLAVRLAERAGGLLSGFLVSAAARELARVEMLGREVPLLANVDGRTVTARADLVFRLDGRLFVGDYKLAGEPVVPHEVARAYSRAAAAALGEEAGFAVISLSGGVMKAAG